MKKIVYCFWIVMLFSACGESSSEHISRKLKNSHYDIQLEIDPFEKYISVNGSLEYLVEKDTLEEFSVLLYDSLQLKEFSVNGNKDYWIDTLYEPLRWQPHAKRIVHKLSKESYKGDVIRIDFSYEGNITEWPVWSANVIDANWIEMGLYFPWYPQTEGLFTYDLAIKINPEYKVFAQGDYKQVNDLHLFNNTTPVSDFVVCASKQLEISESKLEDYSIKVVNSSLSKSTVDSILSDVEQIYKNYIDWFGSKNVFDMSIVISERKKGGGYARKGALYLGGFVDSIYLIERANYMRYLGHEIAHFWWTGADVNKEDWLNESFAEYSAMMLLREIVDEEAFKSRLEKKAEESKDLPPVWEMERGSRYSEAVLYSKGVVLLYNLDKRVGEEKFLKILKLRIDSNINNTNDFLVLIENETSEEVKEWFVNLLQN